MRWRAPTEQYAAWVFIKGCVDGAHNLLWAQGTAATAVAGVYGALRVQGKSNKELAQQRIVLVGAGSAGTGVARMLALGMVKQVGPLPMSV